MIGQAFESFGPGIRCTHFRIAEHLDLIVVVVPKQRLQEIRHRMAPEVRRYITDLQPSSDAAVIGIGIAAREWPAMALIPGAVRVEQGGGRKTLAVVQAEQEAAAGGLGKFLLVTDGLVIGLNDL